MLMLTNKTRLTIFFKGNYALIGVLLGSALVSLSLGPYYNFDTEIEYAAASSVVNLGLPYSTPGNLVNQPPIGFYINAIFLRVFGSSYTTGVAVITLFGVGCVFLVYKLGKTFYGKRTGLLAASLFALTPWQVILSRSFLIDTQCLFFSLLYLLVGIRAVRKDSRILFIMAGTLFGVALLTKLFAVFTLIPLALIYLHAKPKSLKRVFEGGLFFLPALLFYYAWYEGISHLGLFSVFTHNDFSTMSQGITPSPLFLLKFFVENLGLLFLIAVGVSVAISFWKRKLFAGSFFPDLVFLLTAIGVAAVNLYLVLARGLLVPYVDPVKYDYQLLPALCLLAASLAPKAYVVANSATTKVKRPKAVLAVAVVGIILLAGSVLLNMLTLQALITQDYLMFRVEGDVGYSFVMLASTIAQVHLAPIQGLGFMLIIISLLMANRKLLPHAKLKPESNEKPVVASNL
jgi:4-amino-4-deoxy-L-arabinose transferase-like glycosyltransferase